MAAPTGDQAQYLTALKQRRGEAVLAILKRAAEAGEPCPTNDDIVDEAHLGEASNATAVMNSLREAGLITVVSHGGYRRVIINETGKSTDWTTRPKRYVKRVEADAGRVLSGIFRGDLPPERYLHRDPCFCCGVRGDVGCRHNRRIAA